MENHTALAPTRKRMSKNQFSKVTKWNDEDDEKLINLVSEQKNTNWGELIKYFDDKTPQQLAERWEKVLNPSLIKGSWTREEDETIIRFVHEHGTKSWAKLSTLLPGRIGKQCRERWKNHLDPDVNRNPWTPEEDRILIEYHQELGNQWVKIAEHLPGRSDNSIKNRWNSTLKKRLEAETNGTPRPRRGRPSLKNHPRSADDIPKPPRLEEVIPFPTPDQTKSAGATKILTPSLCMFSPLLPTQSPSGLQSPMLTGLSGFSPYPLGSSTQTPSVFDPVSQQLFSPLDSSSNRMESINLLSPILKP